MKALAATMILLAIFAYGDHVRAKASFERDARPLLEDAPELLAALTNAFDIAETGEGLLLLSGTGMQLDKISPPLTFEAKPKGQPGDYTFIIRIPMRIVDSNGRIPPHRIELILKQPLSPTHDKGKVVP